MSHFTDRAITRTLDLLKGRPTAFRFVRKHLSNTVFHRLAQSAKRNVDLATREQAPVHAAADEGAQKQSGGHWDRTVAKVESQELKGWMDWEFIETEHIGPQVTGEKSVYYLQHFFTHHLPNRPVARALSLGCGGGNLERALIDLKGASHVDGVDASPESIRVATELAAKYRMDDRISYRVADINRIELEPGAYDFVVAKMSLHHFENLDHVYAQVRRALKPGGVFMFNEFVGPTRFQWTDLQLDLANRILRILPESHRRSAFTGETLTEIARPTVEEMIRMDPTEAVNSSQIIPLLSGHFEIVEQRKYGGTLLHLLLNHVMANFDLNDEMQAALVRMILLFERTLVEADALDSDFCYVVAKPLP